ncbi:cysteine-rich venom protein-like [Solea senegalensis]|uniref:Cysteine-rich venom protein-like n=1 Tax=Solea senegalensis TaxID=28829 RepID=A0AAV6RX04_SOLSE|nr:cysteine-rich venom protein-like [Solea senegalensis]KAG7508667.1 cysteine-rich venom protein-like [Solea senegalensis]
MYAFTVLCAVGLLSALWAEQAVAVLATSSEQSEIVNKHNSLRRGVSPTASNMLKMNWNNEAANNAQRWANGCSMNHSPDSHRVISTSGCGENLYMSSVKNSWSSAIQSWYDEVKDWRYGYGSINGRVVGHFTQIVWYRSNQIGCAMAYCPNSRYKYFYVCHYCPPGNYQYTHPYKQGRSCADCPNACDNKLCTNPCPYSDKYSNCPDLKKQHGCNNSNVASWCPASCKCTSQII